MKVRYSHLLFFLAFAISAGYGQSAVDAHPASPVTANDTFPRLITGGGKKGYLSKFSGSSQINDSVVVQTEQGNIGIGTTVPVYPVHVFGTNTVPPPNGQCCVAVTSFVENAASSDSNTVIALEGLASASTGSVQGVNGTTSSPEGVGVFGI